MHLKSIDSINKDIKSATWSMLYFKNKNYNELTGYDFNRVSSIADSDNEIFLSINNLYRVFDCMLEDVREEVEESNTYRKNMQYKLSVLSDACLIKRQLYLEYEKDNSIKNKEVISKIRELFREYDNFKKLYADRFNDLDKKVCDTFFEKIDLDEILTDLNSNKKVKKHNYQEIISDKVIDSRISDAFEELIKQVNNLYQKVYQVYTYTSKLSKMNQQDLERAYFKMKDVNNHARNIYNDFGEVKNSVLEYIDNNIFHLENEINSNEIYMKAYMDEYLLARLQLYYCLTNSEYSNMTNPIEAKKAQRNLRKFSCDEIDLTEMNIERMIESLYQYLNCRTKKMTKEIKKEERVQKVKSFIDKIF